MRAMDRFTQDLIDSLTKLLSQPGQDTLTALQICAPVLITNLQAVKSRAVDRREIEVQLNTALKDWLAKHPQPDEAQQALLEVLHRDVLGRQQDQPQAEEASA
ncbi:hypothetical protein [Pseudomonas oryzihabitans]|uniref:Uncharacterized protein n=1 Tax=Pseudomonas oryzihabitans TaxID=47885 RepID=A0A2Z5AE83_9PSED|nr:hypothetical protein [Pseudomonas oryzihabitans]AXA68603.1 hypothetical protein CE139_23285 [Pseudomonas oryzihabitans]